MAPRKKSVARKGAKKSAKKTVKRSRSDVDAGNYRVIEDLEIPKVIKESKYPWDKLISGEIPNFVLDAEDKENARRIRNLVHNSGMSYISSRELNFTPVVRILEDEEDNWVVAAFVKNNEDEEEED